MKNGCRIIYIILWHDKKQSIWIFNFNKLSLFTSDRYNNQYVRFIFAYSEISIISGTTSMNATNFHSSFIENTHHERNKIEYSSAEVEETFGDEYENVNTECFDTRHPNRQGDP